MMASMPDLHKIAAGWRDPAHLAILAAVSFIGLGVAFGAYAAFKRDADRSCPPPCTLDVGEEHLLRLRGAQPRDALQLAALDPLGLLQLLVLLGYVAFAVLQRLNAAIDVRLAKGD